MSEFEEITDRNCWLVHLVDLLWLCISAATRYHKYNNITINSLSVLLNSLYLEDLFCRWGRWGSTSPVMSCSRSYSSSRRPCIAGWSRSRWHRCRVSDGRQRRTCGRSGSRTPCQRRNQWVDLCSRMWRSRLETPPISLPCVVSSNLNIHNWEQ